MDGFFKKVAKIDLPGTVFLARNEQKFAYMPK